MRFCQSYVSAHEYVKLYGVAVADTAGTQVMRGDDIGLGLRYLHYLVFNFIGQGVFKQIPHALKYKLYCNLYDERADYD